MNNLIAVISDTHDNLNNITIALEIIRKANISTIIHCGDLTSPETARQFCGFRLIWTIGNGDQKFEEIKSILVDLNPDNFCGPVFEEIISGIPVAALHGHQEGSIKRIVEAQKHAFIFHGHSHKRNNFISGRCNIINPGSLGGLFRESRSFAILNLDTGDLSFKEIH